jgi:peptidoglycan-N-acetylglucosamine deacetylase
MSGLESIHRSFICEEKFMEFSKKMFFCFVLIFLFNATTLANTGIMKIPLTAQKVVALTFDDGPHKKYTQEILDILHAYDAKATFFIMGGNAKLYPDLVKKEYAAGHEVANHSYTHPNMTHLSDVTIQKELTKCSETINKAVNVYPIVFRPPYGSTSRHVNEVINNMGFKVVTWSYMINDYDVNKMTPEIISSSVIKNTRPGAIIVMHDGNGNREKTVKALPVILKNLSDRGYKFVTVAELLNVKSYR